MAARAKVGVWTVASVAAAAVAASASAWGQAARPLPERLLNSVTIFGGIHTPSRFPHAVCCLGLGKFDKDYSFSVAVNRRLTPNTSGFSIEGEAGYTRRFGLSRTNDVWAAGVLRYEGFPWDDTLRMTIGHAVGLSYADRVPNGELTNAISTGTPKSKLFAYLGPEVTFSLPQRPDVALVLRVMHRSGWYPTFTKSNTASNLMTVGLRLGF
jgi:hypothetical protein